MVNQQSSGPTKNIRTYIIINHMLFLKSGIAIPDAIMNRCAYMCFFLTNKQDGSKTAVKKPQRIWISRGCVCG